MNDLTHGVQFIFDNFSLIMGRVGNQLVLTLIAFVIAAAIAVPVGVWLGHLHRGSFVAINVSNVGRALPSLVVIAILVAIIGIGDTPLIVALVLLAVPPILTNAYVAVDQVDRDVVDAARGIGFSESRILREVELPLALPLLFAGIRTAVLYIVATVPLGALVGTSGGLGEIISNQAAYRIEGVIGASIAVAVLALLLDGALAALQRAVTPRGLKSRVDHAELKAVSTTQQARSATP